jgi:ribosomal protein S18 acetylase RimI-like enzyme
LIRQTNAVADLEVLEPLWGALQEHHAAITPSIGETTPKRELADAWRMRRSKYERWLSDPETFVLIAEASGEPVGNAFVTVGPGHASWATGERLAELQTLSVLAEHRGEGIGASLIEAVWERLATGGVDEIGITTTITNVDAHRFYERLGFEQHFVVYYGKRE